MSSYRSQQDAGVTKRKRTRSRCTQAVTFRQAMGGGRAGSVAMPLLFTSCANTTLLPAQSNSISEACRIGSAQAVHIPQEPVFFAGRFLAGTPCSIASMQSFCMSIAGICIALDTMPLVDPAEIAQLGATPPSNPNAMVSAMINRENRLRNMLRIIRLGTFVCKDRPIRAYQ